MKDLLLKRTAAKGIEKDSVIMKDIDTTLYYLFRSDDQKIYDALIKAVDRSPELFRYMRRNDAVFMENPDDIDQTYIRGVVDGMRFYISMMDTVDAVEGYDYGIHERLENLKDSYNKEQAKNTMSN